MPGQATSTRAVRFLCLAAVTSLLALLGDRTAAYCKMYYVAVNGTPEANGSWTRPWDLQTALNGGNSTTQVVPGDTVWIRGGRYRGAFMSLLMGHPGRPIIVRGYKNPANGITERVILDTFLERANGCGCDPTAGGPNAVCCNENECCDTPGCCPSEPSGMKPGPPCRVPSSCAASSSGGTPQYSDCHVRQSADGSSYFPCDPSANADNDPDQFDCNPACIPYLTIKRDQCEDWTGRCTRSCPGCEGDRPHSRCNPSGSSGFWTAYYGLTVAPCSRHVVFWGLEFVSSEPGGRNMASYDGQAGPDKSKWTQRMAVHPMAIYGSNIRVINSVVHDGDVGVSWNRIADYVEFYGSLLFNNGLMLDDNEPYGNSMYIQSGNGNVDVRDCIVWNNFNRGLQLYGNAGSAQGLRFDGSVVFGSGAPGSEARCFPANGRMQRPNLEVASAQHKVGEVCITNSHFFTPPGPQFLAGIGTHLNGGGCPCEPCAFGDRNLLVCGSRFSGASPVVRVQDWDAITWASNTIVGGAANSEKPLHEQHILELGNDTVAHRHDPDYRWHDNRYYAVQDAAACAGQTYKPFHDAMPDLAPYSQGAKPFSSPVPEAPSWQKDIGIDVAGSSYSCGSLPTNYAAVRPNKYEKRRAHIVVYNWKYLKDGTTKVGVSLSGAGLTPGDKVTIYDIQRFDTDLSAVAPSQFGKAVWYGTYTAGKVAVLDLGTLTAATAPIGLTKQCTGDTSAITQLPHTAPLFAAFLLIATPSGAPSNPSPVAWNAEPSEHNLVKNPSVLPCPDPQQPCTQDRNAISPILIFPPLAKPPG